MEKELHCQEIVQGKHGENFCEKEMLMLNDEAETENSKKENLLGNDEYQQGSNKKDDCLKELQDRFGEMKIKLKETNDKVNYYEERIFKQEMAMSIERDMFKAREEDLKEEYSNERKYLQNEIKMSLIVRCNLEKEIKELSGEVQLVKDNLDIKHCEIDELKNKLKESENYLKELNCEIDQFKNKLKESEDCVKELNCEIDQLKNKLKESEDYVKESNCEIDQLKNKLKESENPLKESLNHFSENGNNLKELQDGFGEMEFKLKEANNKVIYYQDRIYKLEMAMSIERDMLKTHENEMKEEHSNEQKHLQKEIKRNLKACCDLEKETKELSEEKRLMKNNLDIQNCEIDELKNKLKLQIKEIESLNEHLKQNDQQSFHMIKLNYESLKSDYNTIQRERDKQLVVDEQNLKTINKLNDNINELKYQLQEAENRNEIIRKERNSYMQSNERIIQENNEALNRERYEVIRMRELMAKCTPRKLQIDLEKELQSKDYRIEELERKLSILEEEKTKKTNGNEKCRKGEEEVERRYRTRQTAKLLVNDREIVSATPDRSLPPITKPSSKRSNRKRCQLSATSDCSTLDQQYSTPEPSQLSLPSHPGAARSSCKKQSDRKLLQSDNVESSDQQLLTPDIPSSQQTTKRPTLRKLYKEKDELLLCSPVPMSNNSDDPHLALKQRLDSRQNRKIK